VRTVGVAFLLALLLAGESGVGRAGEPVREPLPAPVESGPAEADSVRAAPSLADVSLNRGGDVWVVRSRGAAEILADEDGVRLVGSGWHGHRASVAFGALPASFVGVRVFGVRVADWATDGLDLLACSLAADGVVVCPSGPDLSVWPVYSAELLSVDAGVRGGVGLPVVLLDPGRAPGPRPYARLSMASGELGRRAFEFDFGRRFRSGAEGLSWFLETGEGRAPIAGGSYDAEATGGRVTIDLTGRWRFGIDAVRVAFERGLPFGTLDTSSVSRSRTVSHVVAAATDGRSSVRVFHELSWLSRVPGGCSLEVSREGGSVTVALEGAPVDTVVVGLDWRRARGTVVVGGTSALGGHGLVSKRVALGDGWSVRLAAGLEGLDRAVWPVGVARLAGPGTGWAVGVAAGGRPPTIVERLLEPCTLPASPGLTGSVRGNDDLRPETAVVLHATYERPDVLAGVRVSGEVARLFSPIALVQRDQGELAPENAADETTGALAVSARVGDAALGGSVTVEAVFEDVEGAVLSRAPAPLSTVSASAWFTRALFARGYLSTRWTVDVRREQGLARGPWAGLVEDSATVVSLGASASVGAARVFLVVENVLDASAARYPGADDAGRLVSLGFSWDFWD